MAWPACADPCPSFPVLYFSSFMISVSQHSQSVLHLMKGKIIKNVFPGGCKIVKNELANTRPNLAFTYRARNKRKGNYLGSGRYKLHQPAPDTRLPWPHQFPSLSVFISPRVPEPVSRHGSREHLIRNHKVVAMLASSPYSHKRV